MRLLKEFRLLVLLELCIVATSGYRVDTKPADSQSYSVPYDEEHVAADVIKVQETFNPGHPQHGGWRKPENPVQFESSVSDNQWHAGDSSGQEPSPVSRNYENYKSNSNKLGQTVSFPKVEEQSDSGKYSTFTGGSLNHGGDLIVGQGSVQRPANLGSQYHSGNFGQGAGAYPVQAHIAPGASQFSQVISSGSKKPSYSVSEHPEYANPFPSGGSVSAHRPVPVKPQLQQPQKGPFPGFSSQNGQGGKFPQNSAGGRPPSFQPNLGNVKPGYNKPKPIESFMQSGPRFPPGRYPGPAPPGGPVRSGPKIPPPGTKFLSSSSQPIRRFPLPPSSAGHKYFHQQ